MAVTATTCTPSGSLTQCTTCLTPNFCLTCNSGLVVSATGQCITTCLPSGGTGGIQNCLVCASSATCQICQNGYYLIAAGTQCISCNVAGCQTCNAANSCAPTGCFSGYNYVAPASGSTIGTCTLGNCFYPCQACDSNGGCTSCKYPYNSDPFNNGTCFTCSVANCKQCQANTPYVCQTCNVGYAANSANTACTWQCPSPQCTQCSVIAGVNTCSQCASGYTVNNAVCSKCNNAPICVACQSNNLNFCTACAPGYYVTSTNTCAACAISTCSVCTPQSNGVVCTTFMSSSGLQSFSYTPSGGTLTTYPYICDVGCAQCLSTFPATCTQCSPGYYVAVNNNNIAQCFPCGANCLTCQSNNINYCLSCYSNGYLTAVNDASGNPTSYYCAVCTPTSNCLTCSQTALNSCTTCPFGYMLASAGGGISTCNTPCPANCVTCFNALGTQLSGINPNNIACSSCETGYGLSITGSCLPCLSNCRVCSGLQQSICIECGQGFYLNSNYGCSLCSMGCSACTPAGCTTCLSGYNLAVSNGATICAPLCNFPCASCNNNSPNSCTSCLFGYTLSGTTCTVSTCSTDSTNSCYYCGVGSVLVNGACTACGSNCWRCNPSSPSQCTSCPPQYFLSGTSCVACSSGCQTCTSASNCVTCSQGYTQVSTAVGVNQAYCAACLLPCLTCFGTP